LDEFEDLTEKLNEFLTHIQPKKKTIEQQKRKSAAVPSNNEKQ